MDVPLLVVAGANDDLAPPASVRPAYARSSRDKTYRAVPLGRSYAAMTKREWDDTPETARWNGEESISAKALPRTPRLDVAPATGDGRDDVGRITEPLYDARRQARAERRAARKLERVKVGEVGLKKPRLGRLPRPSDERLCGLERERDEQVMPATVAAGPDKSL